MDYTWGFDGLHMGVSHASNDHPQTSNRTSALFGIFSWNLCLESLFGMSMWPDYLVRVGTVRWLEIQSELYYPGDH